MLFYAAVALFLVSSTVIIFYAQGYKYSFSENKFFKTGAIFLKTDTSAAVFVDDEYEGGTSFLGNNFRLEGLLPNQYGLRVEKENYFTWAKIATVDEGLVTEFSKIILIPRSGPEKDKLVQELVAMLERPPVATSSYMPFYLDGHTLYRDNGADEPERISNNARGFAVSESRNKLVWWTPNEIWVLWINDANYQPYRLAGEKELITRFSTPITSVMWFRGEDHLFVESGGYKILELDTRGGINIAEL